MTTQRDGQVLKSDVLLLSAAAIWGFAFVAQRLGMRHVGPFLFNGIRFGLGSLSLLPVVRIGRKCGRGFRALAGTPLSGGTGAARGDPAPFSSRQHLLAGLLAGSILFGGASLQQIGIIHTTAGKAGFITGLYVVLVPFLGLFLGHRPGWGRHVGAVLAAAGLYFLSVTGRFTVGRGDLLVLLSAFFWACHVLVIGWLSPRVHVITLACLQYAVCSVLSLFIALCVEPCQRSALARAGLPILYGGFFSVGIAYTLQVVAQRKAQPSHAAILLSLEGVFAVLGGWLILGETLTPRGALGCGLMLAAMFSSQSSIIFSSRKPR
jgi:drug/metabolite transporter (DMT)-like permease